MLTYNNIYLEDCISGMKKIDNDSVDVIIIDPPYNIGKDFGNDSDKMEFNSYLNWCEQWLFESFRILKSDGSIFIYGFSEILSYIFVRINYNKRWLIWHYKNKNSSHDSDWQRSHESIILTWKNNRIFNIDDIRVPYSTSFLNSVGKKRSPTKGRFGNKTTIYNAHEKGAKPRDVIEIPALSGGSGALERFNYCKNCDTIFSKNDINAINHTHHDIIEHPTQKPSELSYKLLTSSIKKNSDNLIVIPFAGTGTEVLSCKKMNLNYIAFEINEDYVKMANKLLISDRIEITSEFNNIFF